MREEKIYFENQGQKIESILYSPENKTDSLIILVHGFTGSRDGPGGLFIKLAEKLVFKNFAALRFNFRFTSEDFSEFHKMTIDGEVSDLKLIINGMSKKYDKIGLVGTSMGGTISILSYDERIKYLVLWFPAIFHRETDLGRRFLSKEAAREIERTGFVKGRKSDGREYKVGKEFVEELKNLDIIPYAKLIDSPCLIIHGEKDIVVPFAQSEKLLNFLKGPRKLEKIIGAHHAWENKEFSTDYNSKAQQRAIELTTDWFNQWLK